ncbi:glycosyltransferase family 2 protein [Opitutales bacterium]|nr:glycosyltransferase family 2 protein [Opitutales bacterium]
MKKKLSILIPTVNHNKFIDKTIASCLNHSLSSSFEIIVSVNNLTLFGFEKSNYFKHKNIRWKCLRKQTVSMPESLNSGLKFCTCDWLFILSDDDCITKEFLQNFSLSHLNSNNLYTTRIRLVDENEHIIEEKEKYSKNIFSRNEALDLFFNDKIDHHLSTFVFNRALFDKTDGYHTSGYPNGYFIDSVLHCKLISNCESLHTADEVVFERRIFPNQSSMAFYFNKNVNIYIKNVVESFLQDENVTYQILKRYRTKKIFYRLFLKKRFKTEWFKLRKINYTNRLIKRSELIFFYFLYWDAGLLNKLHSIIFIIKYFIALITPKYTK